LLPHTNKGILGFGLLTEEDWRNAPVYHIPRERTSISTHLVSNKATHTPTHTQTLSHIHPHTHTPTHPPKHTHTHTQ
jgi:hypothetical protein